MTSYRNFGIVGGGAWGTALAQLLAADGAPVRLWAREADVVAAINAEHRNPVFLPGAPLSSSLTATTDLAAMTDLDALLVVVPVPYLRAVLTELPPGDAPLVFCSKGMEAGSFAFPVDMARDLAPGRPHAVLSGPTFAHEVAAGLPTAITLAAADPALATELAQALARPHFRPYVSTDVIGAEIGGAVKNILAIACGIVEGAGLGLNARAALISRGFAEMTRFGLSRGAKAETLAGLAGLGDLVLTCTSANSRNFALGQGLGRGEAIETLMADRRTIAEGAFSAPVVAAAARADGVDMPITDTVARLVAGEMRVADAIQALLSRPLRPEGQ
ncbi:NAD(P)H-dependent glycerol-3-phosphate dehydrogenase [Sphingopyxis alaskensis]|jgi:glycerol-3-phosphate dehydrogenase (NAD(P)+)|uniref:Glycerol-3-phosphate dehydrogenase [NAD(P)+] 1 n=1 Tax=Sphingopyxis alaskensis (strain DSM 13593 / LMG 18877 / RB2256) TaxID=317655 RepID=GPDA1_SPHAL|nr:NAD(P)H-dependent glycerol-3-phosphate dehydrogenase [Sphingopyxis alaskensis]Q1GP43.1 RecName: Full=Glycerol-3-phosphate dehydrogenase [NAD(P)+] 1; AltName: Full=NAD(P)H-dependent glycerol-3-phosphate dehydrogenase 1 [Sphingopyxis alaskensis RB2256]ABF54579.1 Glycerol-3-phosphate dehydrogenase (NAD(P)+) [Sphingopyxis alaskensis RB2256]MCM3418580.1 NAD(P)-dependent glycerol-3-phosphate dehydrogenase [Sphingopyxis alaskensis]